LVKPERLALNLGVRFNTYQRGESPVDSGSEDAYLEHTKSLLTLSNIQYIVQGLDALLQTNLDGDKRIKVIELRDELLSYINSIFTDYA
jgi:hypothetical protein